MTACDPEFELLVDCCRGSVSSIDQDRLRRHGGGIDWSRFASLAKRHRVEGLVWRTVEAAAIVVPPRIAARLKKRALEIARQNLLSAAQCKRLQATFAGAGIDILFVKGLTLGVLAYGSIVPKAASDVDVLVAPEALLPACKILGHLGYRMVLPDSGDDAALSRWHAISKESVWLGVDGSTLELHSSLADHPKLIPSVGIGSPRQAVEVASGVHLETLARDELFAYLCVHGASSAWFRLKWVADLAALLAGSDQAETTRLHNRAVDLGAGVPAAAALILVHRLFGVSVGEERMRRWLRRAPIRLLVHASMKSMQGRRGEVELHQIVLGSIWIHLAQLGMVPSLAGKLSEARRQLRTSLMSRQGGRAMSAPARPAA